MGRTNTLLEIINACTIMNDTLEWNLEGNRDASKSIDIDIIV